MTDPFARWGAFIYRSRWIVLLVWVGILGVCGAALAPNAASVLKAGGIEAADSESAIANDILEQEFNTSTLNNAVVVFRSDELTFDQPEFRGQVEQATAALTEVEGVTRVVTVYNSGQFQLVSEDRHTTIAVVSLEGDEGEAQERVPDVRAALEETQLEHYVTGIPAVNSDFSTTSEEDLRRAEMVTIPLVLILLLLTFRTVIAAAVPLVLGAAAVMTALSAIYLIGDRTDLSVFSLNVASMIGLGLGIDFSLIVVNRFREEIARGRRPADAVAMTLATAGRSITYSGITVVLGMLVMSLLIDLMVVRSISLGVSLVALTALAGGVTLLPAVLGILGHRLEWLRVMPKPRRRARADEKSGFWYRFSQRIMRRPWAWLMVSLVILAVIAWPARNLHMIGSDPGLLPDDTESVQGAEILNEEFGENVLTPIQVVVQGQGENSIWNGEFLDGLDKLTNTLALDPRVSQVQSLSTYMAAEPRDGRWQGITDFDFTPAPPIDPLDPAPNPPGITLDNYIDVWVDSIPYSPSYFGFGQFTFAAGEQHELGVTPTLQVYRVNSGSLTVQAAGPASLWRFANFGRRDGVEQVAANTPVTLAAGDQLVVPPDTGASLSAVDAVDMLVAVVFHVRPGLENQDNWTEGEPSSDPFAGIPRNVIGGGLGMTNPTGPTNIVLDLSSAQPQATFPRHIHPGPELIVTESGTLTIFSTPEMVMTSADGRHAEGPYDTPIPLGPRGKAVVQGFGIHRAINNGSEPAVVWSLRLLDAEQPSFVLIGVEQLASQFVNVTGPSDTVVVNVISKYGPNDELHEAIVTDLRELILPATPGMANHESYVGGQSANLMDFRDELYGRFPLLIGAVLALTFLILMMFFQSVFLPFKAILMNLASILATYGALVMIFQYGWGSDFLGFEPLNGVSVVTPAILFVILFSLSTDYEVFMLSRVKEYYHATGDNDEAVASGLQHTAGVITAAGLILIGVFGSFATAGIVTIKEIGLGLAIGVLLDTTIVRVVMVPATMKLAGAANWYMPEWLKKIVPELREGPVGDLVPAPAGSPMSVPPQMPISGSLVVAVQGPRMAGQLRPIGGRVGTDLIVLPRARPFRIGRDEASDLQVYDPRISRNHAQIQYFRGQYVVSDLGSTNGVQVNGRRIGEPTTLGHNDELEIGNMGNVKFRFELRPLSEAPDAAAAAGSRSAT